MKKKLLAMLLCITVVCAATACGKTNEAETTVSETETATAESDEAEGTISVVDQNGMTATIKENPERVVTTALPLPSIYALTGAPIEYLVGVHPGSTSAIENSVMASMYPELAGIADNFIEGTDINVEELLKLEPDVVLYWAEYLEQYEAMNNAGISAVGFKTQGNGDVLETLESWLGIMGEIFGTTGNVEEVIEYGRQVEAEIAEQTAQIADEEKPKVLYLYNHSSEDISVSGAEFYGDYWITAGGGINAAAELTGPTSVNMEQIYEWNPDIIIITTFTETMPEDLYNNTIDGQDWSPINAVANGKVYIYVPCYNGWYYYGNTWCWGGRGPRPPAPPAWRPPHRHHRPVPPPPPVRRPVPVHHGVRPVPPPPPVRRPVPPRPGVRPMPGRPVPGTPAPGRPMPGRR